ncbi:hypothetical protein BsWGS_04622 [Bradybaena similaris]
MSPLLPLVSKSHHFSIHTLVDNKIIWPLILIVEVFIYSCYGIFVNLSRLEGDVQYQSSSLVLSTEVLKFIIALMMTWPDVRSNGFPQVKLKNVLHFSIPAVCYCLNNNLAVLMQDEMDPATFQVLCNLKIASTALLYRVIMKRRLRTLQWVSLGLLTLAGGLNSYSGLTEEVLSLQTIHITLQGLVMTAVYCFVSGFAGVYTEYILKRDMKISLPLQNCFLYTFGIFLNLLVWLFQSDESLEFFQGYTIYTWAIIISQAVNGLVMSLIMKHSTNIVRLFVITSAIPVATLLSIFIFNLQPGFEFLIVVILVSVAVYIYNHAPKS